MSLEVLLNTPEISVLGPPSSIDLQVDIGPRGQRGSQIYSGFDDPNTTSPSNSSFANDIFIRQSQGQTEGYIYQFLSDGVGGYQWELIGTLKPSIFSSVSNIQPAGGLYSFSVPLSIAFSNYSVSSISTNNIVAHVTPEISTSSKPLLATIYSKSINTSTNVLTINFNVLQYSGGTWQTSTDINIFFNVTISLVA
jgi:hypothetical protein